MSSSFEWGEKLPTLSAGSRLELRWLTQQDAPEILSVFGDSRVIEYWSSPALEDLEAASGLIDNVHQLFASKRLFQWGICLRETDQVCGTCTLYQLDTTHRRAELGIALGSTSWGQGFGSEALGGLIEFAFDALGLHRLEADIDPMNERSLRLFERQGFRREGYLRERWHQHGKPQDSVFLGLLRRDWRPYP